MGTQVCKFNYIKLNIYFLTNFSLSLNMISKNNCKNILLFLLQIILLYVCISVWSLTCEYLVYGKNKFNNNIGKNLLLGLLSIMLNIIICAIIITLSILPLLCGGWFSEVKINPQNVKAKNISYICKCISAFISIMIILCTYFGFFLIEIYVQDIESPNVFTTEAGKYAFCGFLKTIPIISILGISICIDKIKKSKNQKIQNNISI